MAPPAARWHHVVMKPWLRQGIWLAAALIAPVLLSLALVPLRGRVSDVLIALVLLTVSANGSGSRAARGRADRLPPPDPRRGR